MNSTKIISDGEVKLILGNVNASDSLVSIHNQIATNILCNILKVNNLAEHSVVKEEVNVLGDSDVLEFQDFPVDIDSVELYDQLNSRIDTDIEFRVGSHSNNLLHLIDSDGRSSCLGYKTGQVLANYTGGYRVQDTIAISVNPTDGQKFTIEELGERTTYTLKTTPADVSDIEIGTNEEETATNIAAKVSGSATGSIVSLPVGVTFVSSEFTATGEASNVPEELKYACALIAGGSMSNAERAGGVVSYKLGQKSVNFRSDGEAEATKQILDAYVGYYQTIQVL